MFDLDKRFGGDLGVDSYVSVFRVSLCELYAWCWNEDAGSDREMTTLPWEDWVEIAIQGSNEPFE